MLSVSMSNVISALLQCCSDQGDMMWKAKVSLRSWDRVAPWPCGIVGKYLQPSHGNEIAPCQVCEPGVTDMDLTGARSPLRPRGTFCLSLSLSLSVSLSFCLSLSLSLTLIKDFISSPLFLFQSLRNTQTPSLSSFRYFSHYISL